MSHPDKVPTSSPSTSRPAPARRRIEKGIRQIRPGVYEVQAFVGRDPITGRMRQVSETTAGGIARAREVRPKLIAKVPNGEHGSPKGPATPSALLDEWLEHNRGILRWAEPTRPEYEHKVEKAMGPTSGIKLAQRTAATSTPTTRCTSTPGSRPGPCCSATGSSRRR